MIAVHPFKVTWEFDANLYGLQIKPLVSHGTLRRRSTQSMDIADNCKLNV